ncbi:MAG: radical SAM family heme chaperone HemW [Christensenellales bacterium]|jgi:oxygen-independent coproporphyrinogen-3 oxidase
MRENIGIYIHIPFCKKKCFYCDFVSYENKENLIQEYIDAVCLEILQNAEILSEYNISTIYFGGGTPSLIKVEYIEKILNTLKLFVTDEKEIKEITIEINPNSASLDKLGKYYNLGINRLSIGLQSTHDKILRNIGRLHTFNDFKEVLKNANAVGFKNISVDLIYPLPGLNLSGFKETLNSMIKLKDEFNIKHISVYNLEVHENTRLDFLLKEGFVSLCNEDEEYKMREELNKRLQDNGFVKYEISNYAYPGFESKHNLCYWNQEKYIGFGVNASSFFNLKRYRNTSNIDKYIDGIKNNKNIVVETEELDKLSLMKEYIILKLRLSKGVEISEFKQKFGTDIFDIFNTEFNSLKKDNLVNITSKNISLTNRGEEVANIVWEMFV